MLTKDLLFAPARKNQLSLALSLLAEAARRLQNKNTQQWAFWINPPAHKVTWIKEGFAAGEFYFVYTKGELVGMFRLLYFDEKYWGHRKDRFDSAAYVHSLTVRDAYVGRGIGALILQKIERQLKAEGIAIFRLDCMYENENLCNYYRNQGFLPVEVTEIDGVQQQLFEKNL